MTHALTSHRRIFSQAVLSGVLAALLPAAAPALAAPPSLVGLQLVAEGLTSPLNAIPLDDGSGRMLIADQVGPIHVLNRDGHLAPDLFADLTSRLAPLKAAFDERGVLGLALHPKFHENRRVFVFYSAPLRSSAPTNFNCTSHLSEFKTDPTNLARLDPASERILLQIDKPDYNHNSGRIAFGPDGLLYIGVGDGGTGNDVGVGHPPIGNGQSTSTLLGKILRIDVDRGTPYAVPPGNPFVGNSSFQPEIYAYGLRNPWGLSFDRGGQHELFVADVGQNLFEEVNIIVKGGNYGWNVREGFAGFDPKNPDKSPAEAPTRDALGQAFVDPIFTYKHPPRVKVDRTQPVGISVTGGYVYRGKAFPHLAGKYVFGDWSRSWALPDGLLFAATRPESGAGPWTLALLEARLPDNAKFSAYITAFGQDAEGELYVLTSGRNSLTGKTGKVYKLTPP